LRKQSASDSVTGAKFEENDKEKNPQGRPGHSVKGTVVENVDPETARKREAIRTHQESCPRPTWAEEIRTIMEQKEGFAVLSTQSKKFDGYPLGSIVGYAVDDKGRPFFSFSGMSSHTQNILVNGKASLCVTEAAFKGAADARVTLLGDVKEVGGSEGEELRKLYMNYHPGAYWASFGDFKMYRMETIKDISFVGGFARAGGISVEEYMNAKPDPLQSFAMPVMKHMNEDHVDALKEYVQYIVGVEDPIDKIEMKRLDKLGFDVRVARGSDSGVLRIPFEQPVLERKAVKEAIVALSKKVATIKAEKEK